MQDSRAVAEKPHDAVVKFDSPTYRNLRRHRVVLPAIAPLLFNECCHRHIVQPVGCVIITHQPCGASRVSRRTSGSGISNVYVWRAARYMWVEARLPDSRVNISYADWPHAHRSRQPVFLPLRDDVTWLTSASWIVVHIPPATEDQSVFEVISRTFPAFYRAMLGLRSPSVRLSVRDVQGLWSHR